MARGTLLNLINYCTTSSFLQFQLPENRSTEESFWSKELSPFWGIGIPLFACAAVAIWTWSKRRKSGGTQDSCIETEGKEPMDKIATNKPSGTRLVYAECVGHNTDLIVDYVLCSDDSCPCDQTKIARNSGYIYVNKEFVDFRQDCLTWEALDKKLQNIRSERDLAFFYVGTGIGVPIMMCEQGAKRRGLDLDVAAFDAKHWWKTGQVPLRITPLKS